MVSLRAITSWKKKLGIVVVVVAVVQLLFVFSTNTAATGEEDSRAGLPLASQTTRRLQTYELIGSYEPVTLVTDEVSMFSIFTLPFLFGICWTNPFSFRSPLLIECH
jgi:hypothetical protein